MAWVFDNLSLVEFKASWSKIIFYPIDKFGINGDFVESQAFGYLAIRTLLDLPITFPNTTSCKSPTSGGVIIKNF